MKSVCENFRIHHFHVAMLKGILNHCHMEMTNSMTDRVSSARFLVQSLLPLFISARTKYRQSMCNIFRLEKHRLSFCLPKSCWENDY